MERYTLTPLVRINLDLPDGRSLQEQRFARESYSAATEHADVRIAGNRFEGDLHRYRITAAIDEVSVDVTLTRQVPSWRPGTGHVYFGADKAHTLPGCPPSRRGRPRCATASATRATRPPGSATTTTTGAMPPCRS
jgi:hypothetical protein